MKDPAGQLDAFANDERQPPDCRVREKGNLLTSESQVERFDSVVLKRLQCNCAVSKKKPRQKNEQVFERAKQIVDAPLGGGVCHESPAPAREQIVPNANNNF